MKKVLLVVLSLSIWSSVVAGGGWTKEKGAATLFVGQFATRSDQLFGSTGERGERGDIATISLYTTFAYLEYGITNRLTGIAYLPLFSRITLNRQVTPSGLVQGDGDEENSIGDIDLGLQFRIASGDWGSFSVTGRVGIPTGNPTGGSTMILQTGDGEFNQMLRFDYSAGFSSKGYFSLFSAVNNRTKGFSEEFHYGGEVGYSFHKKFTLIVKYSAIESFFNGDDEVSAGAGIFSNNLETQLLNPELVFKPQENWGLIASYTQILGGKNVLARPAYKLGAFFEF